MKYGWSTSCIQEVTAIDEDDDEEEESEIVEDGLDEVEKEMEEEENE